MTQGFDLVGAIMDYEQGYLGVRETLELFSHLIKSGQAWSLQGSYGRAAQSFIDEGLILTDGSIDWTEVDYRLEEYGGDDRDYDLEKERYLA